MSELSEEGFALDENGIEYGWCNACGEEAQRDTYCCPDGEVVAYD